MGIHGEAAVIRFRELVGIAYLAAALGCIIPAEEYIAGAGGIFKLTVLRAGIGIHIVVIAAHGTDALFGQVVIVIVESDMYGHGGVYRYAVILGGQHCRFLRGRGALGGFGRNCGLRCSRVFRFRSDFGHLGDLRFGCCFRLLLRRDIAGIGKGCGGHKAQQHYKRKYK